MTSQQSVISLITWKGIQERLNHKLSITVIIQKHSKTFSFQSSTADVGLNKIAAAGIREPAVAINRCEQTLKAFEKANTDIHCNNPLQYRQRRHRLLPGFHTDGKAHWLVVMAPLVKLPLPLQLCPFVNSVRS